MLYLFVSNRDREVSIRRKKAERMGPEVEREVAVLSFPYKGEVWLWF
jgi:hypothetical protein